MIKIVKDKVKSLREISKEVPLPLSEKDEKTLKSLVDYLKLSQDEEYREKHPSVREGVGLASPQIGINKRMLVVMYKEGEKEILHALVNPKITVSSIKKSYLALGEGCLSVDDYHPGKVYRSYRITVEAYDGLKKENVTIKAEGFEAIVLQHEIDHLNGILFYDRIDKNDPDKVIPGAVAI